MTGAQDKKAKLVAALKAALGLGFKEALLFNAEVKSVEGQGCTVMVGDLELTDVRLKATINDSENALLLTPKKGSMVLCGDMSGNLTDLCVLSVDEIETISYKQDGLEFVLDSTTGKLELKNKNYSMLTMMQDIKSIIEKLKVTTPSGPSTGLLPDSTLALEQWENKFKQLLK